MSAIKPIYRLELRAPRSETIFTGVSNADEAAILQPPAGASHRDWFRVASEAVSFAAKLAGNTGNWLSRNPVATWPTGDLTVEAWFRADDPERQFGLFSYAVSAGSDFNHILIFCRGNLNSVEFTVAGSGSAANFTDAAAFDGKWHQIIITRSGSTVTSYLDGAQKATGAANSTAITGGGALFVGQEQDALGGGLDANQALDGAVAMVRTYNRALTAQEVAEHYRGIYASETGLVLLWDFEGMGRGTKVTTVIDKSSGGNDGTAQGVEWIDDTPTGWKPYLSPLLRGRGGRIDLKGRKLDIGSRTLTVLDKRTAEGGSNLARWWSSFWGDAKGRPRGQLKAMLQESLDDGATWADLSVGRASATALDRAIRASITVRDEAENLKRKVFVGQPHSSITYVSTPTLLPLGLIGADYGLVKASAPLKGTARDMTVGGVGFQAVAVKMVELDATSLSRMDNVLTENLRSAVAPNTHPGVGSFYARAISLPNFSGTLRARIKHTSGALNGQTGDYRVGMLNTSAPTAGNPIHVTEFAIQALPTGDVNTLALPAAGVTVEFHCFVDAPATKGRPLLIADVDPATLLIDLAAGKFGYLWRAPETLPAGRSYGDVKWTAAVATTGAGAPSAHVGTRPTFRGIIDANSTFQNWVEKHLLKQYHWSVYLDASGRLNLVDLRLPSSLAGIATLIDADLVADQELGWQHDPTAALYKVEVKRYLDVPVTAEIALQGGPFFEEGTLISRAFPRTPRVANTGNIESHELPITVLDLGTFDYGDETAEIDATGFRTMDGESYQNQDRGVYLEKYLVEELTGHLRRPWAYGLTTIDADWRRTATVEALAPGSLVLVAASQVPDPTTHARGGTRLCRVLEKTPEGAKAALRLLDLAVNVVAAAPALTQPAQETGNTYTGVTTVLTLNAAGQPAQVRYAVTDTATGSPPADGSQLWSFAGTFKAAAMVAIRNVPPNSRVWVQGRTFPTDAAEPQLLSAWVNAAGTGRADTAALPAPSALATAAISGQSSARTRRASWTNGATDLMVEVALATPVTDPRRRIATLLPGATSYDLFDLIPATAYRVGVRHSLGGFYRSAEVTADFTTDSTGTVAPALGGLSFVR